MKLSKLQISERLKEHGLKSTNQRIVIYEALYKMVNHPTADGVYDRIHAENPSITLATIYKALEAFAEAGLVHKISCTDGKLRYDANTDAHHHVYCLNTNEVYDFYDEDLEKYLKKFIASRTIENFEIKDLKLMVKGNKVNKSKRVIIK